MNTPDARRIFEAIAMILSNRNDGVRVQLSEIKTKAAKASGRRKKKDIGLAWRLPKAIQIVTF